MADWSSRLHPPAFSWNAGMVLHVLKSDPALRELEHIQVDSPRLAYLFFHDRHGCWGLMKEAALTIRSHLADTFAEWIGSSMHFKAVPLLLEEGCCCTTAAQERCRHQIWTQEQPSLPIHMAGSASSRSLQQLVGRVPPIPESQDGAADQEMPRASAGRLCRCPTKVRLTPGGGGEAHHLPHQNTLVEQSQMTIQWPVSQVEATGIEDAGEWRRDWHQQDWTYPYSTPQMPLQMWLMRSGASM